MILEFYCCVFSCVECSLIWLFEDSILLVFFFCNFMVIMVLILWIGFLLKLNYFVFYGFVVGVNFIKRLIECEEMFEKWF